MSISAGQVWRQGARQSLSRLKCRRRSEGVRTFSRFLGQACAHIPQPTHFFSSTTGNPSGPMAMASNRHTRTQSPWPMQPTPQTRLPPKIAASARQVLIPR